MFYQIWRSQCSEATSSTFVWNARPLAPQTLGITGKRAGWNCDMCKNNKEENTQHIFECSAYEDLTKELKDRSSLQEILRKNETEKVAETIRKIISRRDEFQKMESPPLP